jgi:hypothetical protein
MQPPGPRNLMSSHAASGVNCERFLIVYSSFPSAVPGDKAEKLEHFWTVGPDISGVQEEGTRGQMGAPLGPCKMEILS